MQSQNHNVVVQQLVTTMSEVSISIDVPDLDRGQSCYCEALGCTFLKQGSEGIRVLDAGNVRIYLLRKEEGSAPFQGSTVVRTYTRHWSPIHLDFGTKDLESAAELVIAQGGVVEGGESGSWGSIAYCSDPFGNGFCLIRE